MYSIEIHEKINKIVEILNLLRIWRNDGESGVFRDMHWKLTYLMIQMSFGVLLILGGWTSDQVNEAVFLFATGIAVLVLAMKLFYIIWKEEDIHELILDMGVHCVADSEEFREVNNKVDKLMKFSFGFFVTMIMSCVATTIFSSPVFSGEKRLSVNIWFPVDWKQNTTAYWNAFIFVTLGIACSLISSILNIIIWYLMMNCAIKYQILGNRFRNMAQSKPIIKKRKVSEEEKEKLFLQNLIDAIKTHQKLQVTIDGFKSFFANLFLAQLTTSAICLCGSVYSLAFSSFEENPIQVLMQLAIMVYNIFDIFMVMYFGNEVMLASDRLSYCLFESNWIERSESHKRCILTVTEVLKQPHELVIGKLYTLNLDTFTSIVNSAYSMFNILQNLN